MLKKIVSLFLLIALLFTNSTLTYAADEFKLIGKASFSDSIADGFGISVYKNSAYVASKDGGLRIFNITDKTKPNDVTPDNDALKGTTAIDAPEAVYVNGDYLYVCFTTASPDNTAGRGVRKYDLSQNPEAPEYICTYFATNAVSVYVSGAYTFVADKKNGVKIFRDNDVMPYKTLLEKNAGSVSDFAFVNNFLYVSTTDGNILIYSLHDIKNPLLFTKRKLPSASNITRIVADENVICLSDQGQKKINIIDLNSIGNDLVYFENAKLYSTSLGSSILNVRDMDLRENYLYISDTEVAYIVDISNPGSLKLCKKISTILTNFELCDGFIVGTSRTKGINIVSLGTVPVGNEIIPYEVVLKELIEKNAAVTSITFTDITSKHNRTAIEKLADKCIIAGNGDGLFHPDNYTTYAEYLVTLMRLFNLNPVKYNNAYTEVSANDWFADYVQTAKDIGILQNYNIEFNENINRLDAALLTYNALSYVMDNKPEFESNKEIADKDKFDSKNINEILYLVEEKIFSLDRNNKFNPESVITRNEMAVCLYNTLNWCENNQIDLTKFRQAPILFRTSDSVKPGDIFSIYGEGIHEGTEVKIDAVTEKDIPETPGETALSIKDVYRDGSSQYASYVLPKEMESGVYVLWAKNEYGWSKPVFLNKARTLWLSSEQISAGDDIYITGRNFDLSEIGAIQNSHVFLSGEKGEFEAKIKRVEPFSIIFTVDENVPFGDYVVSVSNDGILFSESEDGIKLTVKQKTEDPYNLGVSWVDEFNWENIVNVKDFGAKGDATQYDTKSIQEAIDYAAKDGGVVYLPEGTYLTEGLMLPGYVVIAGDGMEKTTLLYRGDIESREQSDINADTLIQSDYNRRGKEGRQGIVNITLDVDKNVDVKYQPKYYFWLGNEWNAKDAEKRTAQYIFIKNTKVGTRSFDWEKMEGVSGLGEKLWKTACIVQGDKYLLVEDCKFLGDVAQLTSTYINRYISFRNNEINTFNGNVYCSSSNTIYENNSITRCPWYIGKDVTVSRQGIYSRTNSYVAKNKIQNTGCYLVDGEVIATEAYNSGTRTYGNIIAANSTTLKVSPKTNAAGFPLDTSTDWGGSWAIRQRSYSQWHIAITEGRGLGQTRSLVYSDKDTRTLKVDKPWDIIPDSTSKYTIYLPSDNLTYYDNTASDCSWGLLIYSAGHDIVISNNTGYNTGGIDLCEIIKETYDENSEGGMDCRAWFQYFVSCTNNKFIGPSWKTGTVAILVNTKYESGDLNGRYAYAIDITDNYLEGDGKTGEEIIALTDKFKAEGAKSVGYAGYNGIGLRFLNSKKIVADKKQGQAIIIQNNTMKNLDRGITLGGDRYSTDTNEEYVNKYACSNSEGVIIGGNQFENVTNPYIRYNDVNTVFLDETEEK